MWPVVSTSIASAARPTLARVPPLGCGRALSARVRVRARVVDTDARCRHREGVVDIVRGLLTPRGGYNARWCQQRASVRTTRAHANNARRRPSPEPSSAQHSRRSPRLGPHPAVTGIHARGHTRQSPQSVPGALVGAAQSPPRQQSATTGRSRQSSSTPGPPVARAHWHGIARRRTASARPASPSRVTGQTMVKRGSPAPMAEGTGRAGSMAAPTGSRTTTGETTSRPESSAPEGSQRHTTCPASTRSP